MLEWMLVVTGVLIGVSLLSGVFWLAQRPTKPRKKPWLALPPGAPHVHYGDGGPSYGG